MYFYTSDLPSLTMAKKSTSYYRIILTFPIDAEEKAIRLLEDPILKNVKVYT